jgi:MFS family permease
VCISYPSKDGQHELTDNHSPRITSLYLTAPPYFLGAAVSFIVARNSDRIRERGYHITGGIAASLIGFIITIATPNFAARYAASFFYAPGSFSANALVYSWAVSSAGTTPEKRAAAGAIVNIVGHVGNIISPYFFRDVQAPEYPLAFILMLVFGILAAALAIGTKFYLKSENRKIKRGTDDSGAIYNPYTT